MDFLKKVNGLVLGLAVLLAFGCGGDEPEDVIVDKAKNCTLSRINFGTNGGNYQQLIFDSNGRLTESRFSNSSSGYSLFTHNAANEIIKQEIHEPNGLDINTHYLYASGLLKMVTNIDPSMDTISVHTYSYNANKQIVKVENKIFNDPAFKGIDSVDYLAANRVRFRKYKVNNVTGQVKSDYVSEYTFDNSRNLYGKYRYLFFNPYLISPIKGGDLLPDAHNVISETHIFPTHTSIITTSYQYNSDGYPISWSTKNANGTFVGTYDYNCL